MFDLICKKIPSRLKIIFYKIRGRRPWSMGYFTYKFEYVKAVLNDLKMLEKFKKSEKLPDGYGYALDERVVEYPWVLSRVTALDGDKLLDAGSALNFKEILEFSGLKNKKITIINLNPEDNCFWQRGISYVFTDIRHLPFKDNYFDCVVCLSTIEHVGMDNILYTKNPEHKEGKIFDFEKAVLELKRVLKKESKLFITVPFGKYQNFGRFQQFDSNLIDKIVEIFQPKDSEIDYYKYTKKGWNVSDEQSSKDCEYFDALNTKYFETDFASASRAVACLELIK